MANTNPLKKVKQATGAKRRLVGDMALANNLLHEKEVITHIRRVENKMAPFHMLGSVLGTQGEDENMFETTTKGIGAEFYRTREIRDIQVPARIVDASRVPDTLVPGQNIEVTTDIPAGDADEVVQLKDNYNQVMIMSSRAGINGTDLTLQLVGIPGVDSASGSLLSVGSPLNWGYGNSKGEGSRSGNTMILDDEKYIDFYNVLSILRYDFPLTGSYMADEIYKLTTEAMDGSEQEFAIDLPRTFMRKALHAVDHQLLYSRPNFDWQKKIFANNAAGGARRERPLYAGALWQLDQTPYTWRQHANEPLSKGIKKLDQILALNRTLTGKSQTIYAWCKGLGRQWLMEVLEQEGFKKFGINLFRQLGADEKKVKIGFEVEEYYNKNGTIVIYDMEEALNQYGQFNQVGYNGGTFTPRSGDIYFIPATIKGKDGRYKKPAHIYYKEGTFEGQKVSRAFAFGYTNGLTGRGNGMDGSQLVGLQEDFLRRAMQNKQYQLGSKVDGDEYSILANLSVYVDSNNVQKLTIYK